VDKTPKPLPAMAPPTIQRAAVRSKLQSWVNKPLPT